MEKKKILVICALGYATSTMIKKTIEDFLREQHVDGWYVESIGLNMAASHLNNAAMIVSSLELNQKEYQVPLVNGVSLISGINKEVALNEILGIIRSVS